MKNIYQEHGITLPIRIEIAPEHLSKDVAMLDLLKGGGSRNFSKYSEKEFVKEINKGNVIVAILEDDPIAYAVISNNQIEEIYISHPYKSVGVQKLLKDFLEKLS
jgi:hypothetical protein